MFKLGSVHMYVFLFVRADITSRKHTSGSNLVPDVIFHFKGIFAFLAG